MQICPNWIFICSCASDLTGVGRAVFCKQSCVSHSRAFPDVHAKKKRDDRLSICMWPGTVAGTSLCIILSNICCLTLGTKGSVGRRYDYSLLFKSEEMQLPGLGIRLLVTHSLVAILMGVQIQVCLTQRAMMFFLSRLVFSLFS